MATLVAVTALLMATSPASAARSLLAPTGSSKPIGSTMSCTGWGYSPDNSSIVPCNRLTNKTACNKVSMGELGNAYTWAATDTCCRGTPTECASVPRGSLLECLMINGCWVSSAGECVGKPDSCPFQPPLPSFVDGTTLKMTANKHCRTAGCQYVC